MNKIGQFIKKLRKLPILITGLFLLFGTLFGRAICAFLCPVGLVQELIYKIPTKKAPILYLLGFNAKNFKTYGYKTGLYYQ